MVFTDLGLPINGPLLLRSRRSTYGSLRKIVSNIQPSCLPHTISPVVFAGPCHRRAYEVPWCQGRPRNPTNVPNELPIERTVQSMDKPVDSGPPRDCSCTTPRLPFHVFALRGTWSRCHALHLEPVSIGNCVMFRNLFLILTAIRLSLTSAFSHVTRLTRDRWLKNPGNCADSRNLMQSK